MEKKEITIIIKDKEGKLLLEYSEPIQVSRESLHNMVWIKKGIWTIKELLNMDINQELDKAFEKGVIKGRLEALLATKELVDKAREEGRREAFKEMRILIKVFADNLRDVEDIIEDRLSKLKQ